MQFNIGFGYRTPTELVALARHAEEVGFHGVSFPDHVAVEPEPSTPYPSADGRPSFAPAVPWHDVWALIGGLATVTTRLRFLTTIYLLPLRHPLHVAKAVATASLLSDARVELGVGVGWQRAEFDALGIDFATRGRRTDEAIATLRTIWAPGPSEHHGEHFDFGPLLTEPTLDRPPPILVGGSSRAAIRRAARLGDGFITMPMPLPELTATIETLRAELAAEDRDRESFRIYANCSTAVTAEDFDAVRAAGATAVLVRPGNLRSGPEPSDLRRAMDTFATDVIDALA